KIAKEEKKKTVKTAAQRLGITDKVFGLKDKWKIYVKIMVEIVKKCS
ncbi:TPA: hypothetical protein QCY08_005448, partial [Bacillus paranthracis]|nr:hypothetical protein [Bacillus paranthracis]